MIWLAVLVALVALGTFVARLSKSRQRAAKALAPHLIKMRQYALSPADWEPEPVGAFDPPMPDRVDKVSADLAECGFHLLGQVRDRGYHRSHPAAYAVGQWFRSQDRSVLARYQQMESSDDGPANEVLYLFSEISGPKYIHTLVTDAPRFLASAPNHIREYATWSGGIAVAVNSHIAQLASSLDQNTCLPIESLTQAVSSLERAATDNASWRRLGGEELLRADIDAVLGAEYRHLRKHVLREILESSAAA